MPSALNDPLKSGCFVLALIGFAAIACGSPPVTRPIERPALSVGESGQVKVVFIRPARGNPKVDAEPVTIWDAGAPMAVLKGGEAFVADLAPVTRRFVATASNTDVVEAELAPGKVYFVTLWCTPFPDRMAVQINPLKPESKQWEAKNREIERVTFVEVIPDQVLSWSEQNIDRVRRALAEFDPKGPAAERRITPDHGV